MGCDIHLFVEKRNTGSSKWAPADKWVIDKDDDETPKRLHVPYENSFYHARNYDLFAMLADVRNGSGFAGVRTGDGFIPIAMPKGMPVDACQEILAEAKRWGCDGHSHSHLTVAELMAYDWTQIATIQGEVDGVTFEKWDRYGRREGQNPSNWCGSCHGAGIEHVTEKKLEALCRAMRKEAESLNLREPKYTEFLQEQLGSTYAACRWTQPYYECAAPFLSCVLPKLWRLGTPDNVRIVFWFDN